MNTKSELKKALVRVEEILLDVFSCECEHCSDPEVRNKAVTLRSRIRGELGLQKEG